MYVFWCWWPAGSCRLAEGSASVPPNRHPCSLAHGQSRYASPLRFTNNSNYIHQPNGVAPTFAQVFDTSVSQLVFTMKNIAAFQERFKILKEDIGVATSSFGGDGQQSCYRGYIDLSKLKQADQVTRWNGTTTPSCTARLYSAS